MIMPHQFLALVSPAVPWYGKSATETADFDRYTGCSEMVGCAETASETVYGCYSRF